MRRTWLSPRTVPSLGRRMLPQQDLSETLPKMLPGVVCRQWVRCGRPNCGCARGKLHGPYTYRFFREGGRLRKVYVKASEAAQVRSLCEARRRSRRELAAGWAEWRNLSSLLREMETACTK